MQLPKFNVTAQYHDHKTTGLGWFDHEVDAVACMKEALEAKDARGVNTYGNVWITVTEYNDEDEVTSVRFIDG